MLSLWCLLRRRRRTAATRVQWHYAVERSAPYVEFYIGDDQNDEDVDGARLPAPPECEEDGVDLLSPSEHVCDEDGVDLSFPSEHGEGSPGTDWLAGVAISNPATPAQQPDSPAHLALEDEALDDHGVDGQGTGWLTGLVISSPVTPVQQPAFPAPSAACAA